MLRGSARLKKNPGRSRRGREDVDQKKGKVATADRYVLMAGFIVGQKQKQKRGAQA